ncbi:MAG: hypothetical protein VX498_05675, partial [Myxococcota bacterium]|nr:hypothetical protein [Myxococcota bacterium]
MDPIHSDLTGGLLVIGLTTLLSYAVVSVLKRDRGRTFQPDSSSWWASSPWLEDEARSLGLQLDPAAGGLPDYQGERGPLSIRAHLEENNIEVGTADDGGNPITQTYFTQMVDLEVTGSGSGSKTPAPYGSRARTSRPIPFNHEGLRFVRVSGPLDQVVARLDPETLRTLADTNDTAMTTVSLSPRRLRLARTEQDEVPSMTPLVEWGCRIARPLSESEVKQLLEREATRGPDSPNQALAYAALCSHRRLQPVEAKRLERLLDDCTLDRKGEWQWTGAATAAGVLDAVFDAFREAESEDLAGFLATRVAQETHRKLRRSSVVHYLEGIPGAGSTESLVPCLSTDQPEVALSAARALHDRNWIAAV